MPPFYTFSYTLELSLRLLDSSRTRSTAYNNKSATNPRHVDNKSIYNKSIAYAQQVRDV